MFDYKLLKKLGFISVKNFPVDECTIQNRREHEVYDSPNKYQVVVQEYDEYISIIDNVIPYKANWGAENKSDWRYGWMVENWDGYPLNNEYLPTEINPEQIVVMFRRMKER